MRVDGEGSQQRLMKMKKRARGRKDKQSRTLLNEKSSSYGNVGVGQTDRQDRTEESVVV